MNERRQYSIPQEQFEAIAKRAAELSYSMASDMVREMVREEVQAVYNQKIKEFPHEIYAVIGEMGFKGAAKMFWAVTWFLITAGAASFITWINFRK